MNVIEVSSSGVHPIRVPVFIKGASDPSLFPVKFAFPITESNDPPDTDYTAGTWQLDNGIYYAKYSVSKSEGRYDIWVWVDGGVGVQPRKKVGVLVVT